MNAEIGHSAHCVYAFERLDMDAAIPRSHRQHDCLTQSIANLAHDWKRHRMKIGLTTLHVAEPYEIETQAIFSAVVVDINEIMLIQNGQNSECRRFGKFHCRSNFLEAERCVAG